MDVGKMFDEKLSRRGLIKGAAGATWIAALTMGGLGFLSKAEAVKKSSAILPWPYKKFTPAEIKRVGEIAHDNWFKGFCSYATLSGIVEVLRKKVGEAFRPSQSIMLGIKKRVLNRRSY